MEKPKCKLCGDRHWSREPCKAVGLGQMDAPVSESAPKPSRVRSPAAPPAEPSKGGFDRTAYQRDYMRKRRAEQRGGRK